VFGPTSWLFLAVLAAGFAALLWWMMRVGHLAVRLGAGVLAFAVSSLFGAALVNDNYAYYTTWGSLFADLSGSGITPYQPGLAPASGALAAVPPTGGAHDNPKPITAPPTPTLTPLPQTDVPASVTIPRLSLNATRTTGSGRVVGLALTGATSGITRHGFVYLPPQYFQAAYASTVFPVVELLHGDPGDPTGWIYGLHLPDLLDHEIDSGRIGPMVVVMPSTFGGKHGQDCVDVAGGALDDTYLSTDVPADLVHDFRVLPPGPNWAIGGLSDGGFCAANLALRHPGEYGAVVSLDGFYSAHSDPSIMNKAFGKDAALVSANDPSTSVSDVTHSLPRFWIMSGTANSIDSKAAEFFRQIVTVREPIEYVVVHNGKHTPPAWRIVLPSMVEWTWNTISGGVVGVGTTTFGLPATAPSSPPPAAPATSQRATPTLSDTTSRSSPATSPRRTTA
jgi:S-formylglutathione hydrolase FrmB